MDILNVLRNDKKWYRGSCDGVIDLCKEMACAWLNLIEMSYFISQINELTDKMQKIHLYIVKCASGQQESTCYRL